MFRLCIAETGIKLLTHPSKHSSWWRRLEDVFHLCLQKTSSKRLNQDEYIRLSHTSSEDVFKTSSRRLAKMSSRHPQDVFNTFLRRTAKAVIYRKVCLGHSSEKLLHLLHFTTPLLNAYTGVFRNWLSIYNGAFLAKIINGFKLLTIVAKKAPSQIFRLVWKYTFGFWLRVWNNELTPVPSLQIKAGKYVCHRFSGGKKKLHHINECYAEAAVLKVP